MSDDSKLLTPYSHWNTDVSSSSTFSPWIIHTRWCKACKFLLDCHHSSQPHLITASFFCEPEVPVSKLRGQVLINILSPLSTACTRERWEGNVAWHTRFSWWQQFKTEFFCAARPCIQEPAYPEDESSIFHWYVGPYLPSEPGKCVVI